MFVGRCHAHRTVAGGPWKSEGQSLRDESPGLRDIRGRDVRNDARFVRPCPRARVARHGGVGLDLCDGSSRRGLWWWAALLWRGVASAVLGPTMLGRGTAGVIAGIAVHSTVALMWSAAFVVAVRAWPALRAAIRTPGGAIAVAMVYGPTIWLVMSLVIIPASTGRPPQFGARWWVQLGAHIPFVTLPLVFTARQVFNQNGYSGQARRAL